VPLGEHILSNNSSFFLKKNLPVTKVMIWTWFLYGIDLTQKVMILIKKTKKTKKQVTLKVKSWNHDFDKYKK
jgi:hypothetical protein